MTLEELMSHIENKTVLTSTIFTNACGIPTMFQWGADDEGFEVWFDDLPDQHILKESDWLSLASVEYNLDTLVPMSKEAKAKRAAKVKREKEKLAKVERAKAIQAEKLKEALESRKLSKIMDFDQIEALVTTLPKIRYKCDGYNWNAYEDGYLYLCLHTGERAFDKQAIIITGPPYNRKFRVIEQRLLTVEVEDA